MIVDNVPPEMPPLTLNAVIDSSISVPGPASALRVLLLRYTARSEGTESNAAAGMMRE